MIATLQFGHAPLPETLSACVRSTATEEQKSVCVSSTGIRASYPVNLQVESRVWRSLIVGVSARCVSCHCSSLSLPLGLSRPKLPHCNRQSEETSEVSARHLCVFIRKDTIRIKRSKISPLRRRCLDASRPNRAPLKVSVFMDTTHMTNEISGVKLAGIVKSFD